MSVRFSCLFVIVVSIVVIIFGTRVSAQNWSSLTGRICQADMPQATGIQPFFTLDSEAIKLDASHVSRVALSTTVPTGVTFPFDVIRKALFVPESGLAIESVGAVMLPQTGSVTSPRHGYISVHLENHKTYRVLLFVLDEAMVSQCDAYYVYSVGDVTTSM